ncbi:MULTISPECIES: TM1812 family CRISPR-associated protein [Aliarcobacter]|uniref:TM1812 family CRISPR-associated protein n=1 Tax=Aliarcobacter TaxID=2321111 RepID=UPI00242EFEAB|nr:TM1812 family CRISPR-associated protein [Aliarcobacter skirrowii]MDD2508409.1 TM1812 family CRISPR-associated protein [Aliarcobacter skirrowii]MDD3497592.1 TM1812 family CRISPR-associated protein [Aliarcobacter skirrowii]
MQKGLKIVKKAKTKSVITILGIQGGFVDKNKEVRFSNFEHKADYIFENETKEYFNTLPLLIEKYSSYEIIPIFTEDAKLFNQEVLKKGYSDLKVNFNDRYFIKDDKNFEDIFKIINEAISYYDEVIVDVSHGFRHLPILMIVDLIIQNFQNTEKISKILFAKEIKKHDKEEKGLYEIIDLKEYLDLANISFVLTTFEKNYTVASHIESDKYKNLIEKLNSFSNDLMALNQNNLFKKTSKDLITELDKIENISIKKQAYDLKQAIKKLTNYEGKKRYETYYNLAKDLYDKKYMLLSLSLLYESMRLYAKSEIKKSHKGIVEKVEKMLNGDLYAIGDYIIKLKNKNTKWTSTAKYKGKDINTLIDEKEFQLLKDSFPKKLVEKEFNDFPFSLIDKVADTRNNLAHANSDNRTFKDIQKDIGVLFDKYYNKCIKKLSIDDLKNKINIL